MAKRSLINKKTALVTLNVLVLLGLAGFGGYFFKEYKDLKSSSPEKLQQAQTDQYIAEVGKLYALPTDEKPTIGTVQNKDELKKQYPFFDKGENGDVTLLYPKAKLAILYRPASKQLINVAPLNVEDSASIRTVGSDAERAAVEKILTDNKLTFQAGGTSKTAVTGVLVVDLTGSKGEQAKKLAEIVKGSVGSLPEGEDKPEGVDLLILVGPTASADPTL